MFTAMLTAVMLCYAMTICHIVKYAWLWISISAVNDAELFEVLILVLNHFLTCSNKIVEVSILFRTTFFKYRFFIINYSKHFDRTVPLGK